MSTALSELVRELRERWNALVLAADTGDYTTQELPARLAFRESLDGVVAALEAETLKRQQAEHDRDCAVEALAGSERDAGLLKAILFDHGIIATKVDGGWKYEYDDNSALSPKPCAWSETVQNAKRYLYLRNDLPRPPPGAEPCWMRRGEDLDEAVDAAIAGPSL